MLLLDTFAQAVNVNINEVRRLDSPFIRPQSFLEAGPDWATDIDDAGGHVEDGQDDAASAETQATLEGT